MKEIDGVPIDRLVEEYGSPIFIVSAQMLRNNLKAFREEFSKKYRKVEVAYSYKTNCLLGVLSVIHKDGACADVASGFEYNLARALGVPGKSIIFNGPYKKKEELRKAVKEAALINVDHIDELKLLEEIACEFGKVLEIGIRINADVGIRQLSDRFGFNLESGEASQIVRICAGKKLLRVVGLHIHLTSYIIEPYRLENTSLVKRAKLIWPKSSNMYRDAARKVVWLAGEIREKFGVNTKYIDVGGGFPNVDSLTRYAESVVEPILYGFKGELPTLILEPGRAIVMDAIHLITTVVGAKEFPNGERRVIIDAGINLLPTSLWRSQEIEPVSNLQGSLKETTVYGPLCLQTDIVAKAELPELKSGDRLVIKNVGAYNISQSSSFIFPRPSVLIVENREARVLRRAEIVEDVFLFEKV
jgi:diaminopimelate decarboxylase